VASLGFCPDLGPIGTLVVLLAQNLQRAAFVKARITAGELDFSLARKVTYELLADRCRTTKFWTLKV
jgi:hypothetical protein